MLNMLSRRSDSSPACHRTPAHALAHIASSPASALPNTSGWSSTGSTAMTVGCTLLVLRRGSGGCASAVPLLSPRQMPPSLLVSAPPLTTFTFLKRAPKVEADAPFGAASPGVSPDGPSSRPVEAGVGSTLSLLRSRVTASLSRSAWALRLTAKMAYEHGWPVAGRARGVDSAAQERGRAWGH